MAQENILGKFAHDTKREGVVDACAALQKNLNRLEKWANRNLTKGKCEVLHQGGASPRTGTNWSWPARKQFCRKRSVRPRGQAAFEPVISPCCKQSQMYPWPHVTRSSEEVLLYSALLRSYLQCWVPFRAAQDTRMTQRQLRKSLFGWARREMMSTQWNTGYSTTHAKKFYFEGSQTLEQVPQRWRYSRWNPRWPWATCCMYFTLLRKECGE